MRHISYVVLVSSLFSGQCFAIDISNFEMTTNKYSETENLEQAVTSEFDSSYRIADWNDIVSYYNQGNSVEDFKTKFSPISGTDSSFSDGLITYNGNHWWSSSRHYFYSISRRPGQTPRDGYLSHENIDNHTFDLGSWYDISKNILVYTDNPIKQTESPENNNSSDCRATYTFDGTLHIPCVDVQLPFGGTITYEVKMQHQQNSNPMSFSLVEAVEK